MECEDNGQVKRGETKELTVRLKSNPDIVSGSSQSIT